jgi:hypothetical protein
MARGDQIYAMRELMNISGMYEHHGIDCGDGTVIHYRKPSETIERTSLEIFSQGQRIYVKPYAIRYIADTTIYRAESRLGEREYNLLFNNCEHFATWCVTGISNSKQIRDFLPTIQNINIDQLTKPLREAILGGKTEQSASLIGQALGDIRVAWDAIQPEFKQMKHDSAMWQNVAKLALQKDREDLAREALYKKRLCEKRADELEFELQQLATMTENLLQDQKDLFARS